MTVTTLNVTNGGVDGDGSTAAFPTTFQFWDTDEVQVWIRTKATGAEVLRIEGTHYDVTGGEGATGTVTFKSTPTDYRPQATEEVHLRRVTKTTQQVDLTSATTFPSAATEEAFDRATLRDQEDRADLDRAMLIPVTDGALDMSLPDSVTRSNSGAGGTYLGFDASGKPTIITAQAPATATITAAAQSLLDDTTLEAMRATLAVPENKGNVSAVQTGSSATRAGIPAATFGTGWFIESDTSRIWYSNASSWVAIGIVQVPNASIPGTPVLGLLLLDSDNLVLLRGTGSTTQAIRAPLPRGSLGGLGLTRAAGASNPNRGVTIAVGECRTGTAGAGPSVQNAYVASALTKQLDAAWAEGSPAGGRPSGGPSLGTDQWWHVFVIEKPDGTVDAGFDDNVSATNLLADATGYTNFRRVGSVRTDGSSDLLDWVQEGDLFLYATLPALDLSVTSQDYATADTAITLDYLPPGVRTKGLVVVNANNVTSGLFLPGDVASGGNPDINQPLSVAPMPNLHPGSTADITALMELLTNTSQQITYRVDSGDTSSDLYIQVHGWVDSRGKNL